MGVPIPRLLGHKYFSLVYQRNFRYPTGLFLIIGTSHLLYVKNEYLYKQR